MLCAPQANIRKQTKHAHSVSRIKIHSAMYTFTTTTTTRLFLCLARACYKYYYAARCFVIELNTSSSSNYLMHTSDGVNISDGGATVALYITIKSTSLGRQVMRLSALHAIPSVNDVIFVTPIREVELCERARKMEQRNSQQHCAIKFCVMVEDAASGMFNKLTKFL